MRIPIRRGRGFGPEDRAGAPAVAVVSADFASELWPNQDPIGKQFPFRGPRESARPVTVIGVVDELRSASLEQPNPRPTLYLSSEQEVGQPEMWVVMRSSRGAPLALVGAILDARAPRLRYTTGPFIQRFAVWLRPWLPSALFEWIIRRVYGV